MLTDFYDVLKTDMKSEDSGIQPKIDIIDVETNFSSPTIGGDFSAPALELKPLAMESLFCLPCAHYYHFHHYLVL